MYIVPGHELHKARLDTLFSQKHQNANWKLTLLIFVLSGFLASAWH